MLPLCFSLCLLLLGRDGPAAGAPAAGPDPATLLAQRRSLPLLYLCLAAPLLSSCRGEKALAVVQQLLADPAAAGGLQDIELFSFRAIPSSKRLDIRLDKMTGGEACARAGLSAVQQCSASGTGVAAREAPACLVTCLPNALTDYPTQPSFHVTPTHPPADQYGSPSLDDVAEFSRAFNTAYEAALGEAAAGEIEVEVSSAVSARSLCCPSSLRLDAVIAVLLRLALRWAVR